MEYPAVLQLLFLSQTATRQGWFQSSKVVGSTFSTNACSYADTSWFLLNKIFNTVTYNSKTDVFIERVPPGLYCQQRSLRRKTARGDNAVGNFIWLAIGHRNPHSWGKSRDNASGRVRLSAGDEELCVATPWSYSQTKECHHNLIRS